MPSDPDARRDKALEAIAGELVKTNKLLAAIERNTKRFRFTNLPQGSRDYYFERDVSVAE